MDNPNDIRLTPEFIDEWNRIRHKVDTVSGIGVNNTATSISIGNDGTQPDVWPTQGQMVLVGILGFNFTTNPYGSGKYDGTILKGLSSGNLTNPFQLQSQCFVIPGGGGGSDPTVTPDGPKPIINSTTGKFVNNALVINLIEQYVSGSNSDFPLHTLAVNPWNGNPSPEVLPITYVMGMVMGQTNENPSRTIVYVQAPPTWSIMVTILGQPSGYGAGTGMYYGEMVQTGPTVGYSFTGPPTGVGYYTTVGGGAGYCWVTNLWEVMNGASSSGPTLVNESAGNRCVPGLVVGWAPCADPTGSSIKAQPWPIVMVNMPLLAKAPTPSLTGLSAGTSYTTNEQTMINGLANFYKQMQNAGYTK